MKSACIIIPHIDDDIYSCWSILCDKSYDEIVVLKCSKGDHQKAREPIHNLLMTNPDKYGLNHNIKIAYLLGSEEKTPVDGSLNSVPEVTWVTALDRVTSTDFDEFYYPSYSHHQDHELIHKVCMASLRPREAYKIRRAFEYTYMYNHSTERAVGYKTMTNEDLKHKLQFLKDIDDVDKILSQSSVNSLQYVLRSNINFGAECGADAAEKFILFFELI